MTTREPLTISTRTTIGAAIAAAAVLITHAVWMNNVSRDVADIGRTLSSIAGEQWRRENMRLWAERLGRSNPSLDVPDVDQVINPRP